MSSLRDFQNLPRWYIIELHNIGQLFNLTFSREEWKPGIKFSDDCSEWPHVNSRCVGYSEYDFRRSVESWLDIGVNSLAHETGAAVINDFDARFILLFQEDVLGLEVAMNQVVVLLIFEGLKYLDWKAANQVLWDTLEVVVSDELVEVDGKELEGNY